MANMIRVMERLARHHDFVKTQAAWHAAFERAKAGHGCEHFVCRDCGARDRMWAVIAPPGLSDEPCICCNDTKGEVLIADVTQCVRCAGSCYGCGWPEGAGHDHRCPKLVAA